MPSFVPNLIRLGLQHHRSPYLLPTRPSNLSFAERPIRGVAFVVIFLFYNYFISFTFVGFSYRLCFSLFRLLFRNWYAGLTLNAWPKMHAPKRLFFLLFCFFFLFGHTATTSITCTLYNQLLASSHSRAYHIRGRCGANSLFFK